MSQRSYGGVTATLSYDSLDHFTQWNGGSTNQEWYVYDAAGNRVLKRTTGSGGTFLTSYPFGLEEHTFTSTGTANGGDKYYYSLGGRLIGELNGTTTQYFLVDGLGTPLGSISNVAGSAAIQGNQLYDPYGYRRYHAGTVGTSKQFTGQYNDAQTGLNYYNARYYDSIAGVFLSADVVQGNVSGMNPYGYVGGNPETWSDPSGQYMVEGGNDEAQSFESPESSNSSLDAGNGSGGSIAEASADSSATTQDAQAQQQQNAQSQQNTEATSVSAAASGEVSSADAQAIEADTSGLSTEIHQEKAFHPTEPIATETQTTPAEPVQPAIENSSSSNTQTIEGGSKKILYRVLRPEENPQEGLSAKDPTSDESVKNHIFNGSKPGYKSQFISTTNSFSVATRWSNETGNRIAVIDADKITAQIIDVSSKQALAQQGIFPPSMTYSFALSSREELIVGFVPSEAILWVVLPPW